MFSSYQLLLCCVIATVATEQDDRDQRVPIRDQRVPNRLLSNSIFHQMHSIYAHQEDNSHNHNLLDRRPGMLSLEADNNAIDEGSTLSKVPGGTLGQYLKKFGLEKCIEQMNVAGKQHFVCFQGRTRMILLQVSDAFGLEF